MSSNINYMSHEQINKKMEQWYTPKTHKIQKKQKNEDNRKSTTNKMGQLSEDPNNSVACYYSNENMNTEGESSKHQEFTGQLFSNNEDECKKRHYSDHNILSSTKLIGSRESLMCTENNNAVALQNSDFHFNYDQLGSPQQTSITPKFLIEPSEQRSFCIYNECIIDFDLLDDQQEMYQKSLTQALTNFKKVNQIQKLNNGDFIEVQQESYSSPLIDYTFLINQLKSLNSAEAYKWYQILLIYQQKTQSQISYMQNLQQTLKISSSKLSELFTQRKQFATQLAQKYIKQIPRNQYCLYITYHYDHKSQNIRQSSTGYSRKLLELMGLSIQDAPSVFMRKGPLDLISKKIHTWNLILAAIQMIGHPKKDLIDIAEGDTFIHTLDNIQLQSKIHIKTLSLTNQFDTHNNIELPISDDILVEITYDIDEDNLEKFYEKRKEKKIMESFSIYDIIDGEFEYLMEVENFLSKYYEANLSSVSQKKQSFHKKISDQRQKDGLYNQYPLCIESMNNEESYSSYKSTKQENSQPNYSYEAYQIKKEDSLLFKSIQITKANLITLLDDQDPRVLI